MSPSKLIQGLALCAAALSGQWRKHVFKLSRTKLSAKLKDAIDHLRLFWVGVLQPGSPNDLI